MGTLTMGELEAMVAGLTREIEEARRDEGEQSRRYREAQIELRLRRRQLDRLIYIEAERKRRANLTVREVVDEVQGR